MAVLIPTTLPLLFRRGPPLLPVRRTKGKHHSQAMHQSVAELK